MSSKRRPLELLHKKAVGIKLIDPKFREDGIHEKDGDTEAQKLQRLVKRETKGVIRELRRDAAFVAEQRDKEKEIREQEREAKMRSVMSMLEQEQATINQVRY